MTELFFLPLFPEGALAHSVTTCVWIGVTIIVLFNLRFGWVLSGLVVPGYLAPLMFVKPWAAAVVMFEAVVTYLLAYWFSERGSRLGYWGALFGRDRFFSLILISVIVRLVFDTWLLPEFAVWIEQNYQVAFDFRNNLHSFGLIIICLLANQFWKTGMLKGFVPVVLPIVLTCLVIRYGLMEFTNFSIGNLNFIYEDVAASLMASPKSYMILILAAFIASRMNLHYGWDYNGILIPALLALQWYQPEKILVSFLEAFLILGLARAVMKLPWLSQTNIEGGRKLLLFFNISFFYKFLLGWAILWSGFDLRATDYYGFGYLLTTLIAVKMHDKEIIARLSRATLQTSLVAVLAASVLAFSLSRFDWQPLAPRTEAPIVNGTLVKQTWQPLTGYLEEETLRFYQHRSHRNINKPLAVEIDRFTYALELLDKYRLEGSDDALQQAASILETLNFNVIEHRDWLLIRERHPSLGWGAFVLAKAPQRNLTLELPAPLEDGHLAQVSAHLFSLTHANTLALAGNHIRLNKNQDPLSTIDQTSVFHAFHRFYATDDVLQIRAANEINRRRLGRNGNGNGQDAARSELRIAQALPESLNLRYLQQLAGEFETYFAAPNTQNIQRRAAHAGFAELYLTDIAVRQLLYASIATQRDGSREDDTLLRNVFLSEWISSQRSLIAAKHSNSYNALTQAELLYFDEQVLMAMTRWAQAHAGAPLTDNALRDLAALDAAAGIVAHRVHLITGDPQDPHLVLRPAHAQPVKYSVLFALRVNVAVPQVVQVPRPLSEPGSLEFALNLYNTSQSQALLVAGTHRNANVDGSANVLSAMNKASLFNLINQRLTRNAGTRPLAMVHVRGIGNVARLTQGVDVLVDHSPVNAGTNSSHNKWLWSFLESEGLQAAQVDGSWETWGYENHFALQNRYLAQSRNKNFWTIWVPRAERQQQQFQSNNRQLLAQLTSLGLKPHDTSLTERILENTEFVSLPADIETKVRQYQRTLDVVLLADLLASGHVSDNDRQNYFEVILDRQSRQVYLLVGNTPQELAGAFLLGISQGEGRRIQTTEIAVELADFVRHRAPWFVLERSS